MSLVELLPKLAMVYCWNCSEESEAAANYCSECGSDLSGPSSTTGVNTTPSGEYEFESIEDALEQFLDGHIKSLEGAISYPDEIPPAALPIDKYAFGVEMYLIGQLKGEFSTLITVAAMDWEDVNPPELDFSDVYDLIQEKIDNREEDILALVEPDETEYIGPTEGSLKS